MPVEVSELRTCEPEVAHAALTEVYTPDRPIRFSGDADGFSCVLRSASAGQVAADQMSISMGMQAVMTPPEAFVAATGVAGTCHYASGRTEVPLGPGGVILFSTSENLTARYQALRLHTVRLPLQVLERVATERFATGADDPGSPTGAGDGEALPGGAPGVTHAPAVVRFDGLTPVDEGLRRGWLQVTAFTHAQLSSASAAGSSPLVAAALAEMVAATALVTFPNTTMDTVYSRGPGWVAPVVVRRAVAHIEAHVQARGELPLSVSDVARAAGVGPRALQLAFARHLGTSPAAYLRRLRLQRAHRELLAGDATAGDTVADIARRWGWASASRFGAAYRQVYGVAPSRTLRT